MKHFFQEFTLQNISQKPVEVDNKVGKISSGCANSFFVFLNAKRYAL